MERVVPDISVGDAQGIDSTFVDYKRFEGDAECRMEQRDRFFRGEVWAPDYEYSELDRLHDEPEAPRTLLLDRKAAIQRGVYRLELARRQGEIDPAEAELYAGLHETQLKKMMLVEAAKLLGVGDSAAREAARREFMALNEEIYGEFNETSYMGILRTERDRVDGFEPATVEATQIKAELQQFFVGKELPAEEPPLLDPETMTLLHEYVQQRYGHILAVLPDTDDAITYDASEIKVFFEKALEAAGLTEKGWKVVVDPRKQNPSTAANKQKISLPGTMSRTSSQLKRLILHEMEAHARRGQNGKDVGSKLLEKGTAGYADVEEGLGVLLECMLAGDMDNQSFHRARDRYITTGLALGAGDVPRDSRQTFEIMWRLFAVRQAEDGMIDAAVRQSAMEQAYVHVENAFRGTNFAMPGVMYPKLKIYFEGLQKNAKYFTARRDNLAEAFDDAMIGKYNHTDETEVENIRALN